MLHKHPESLLLAPAHRLYGALRHRYQWSRPLLLGVIAFCSITDWNGSTAQTAAPTGTEFQVNAGSTGYQLTPDVAVAPDGDFVVVWASESTSGLLARRFDSVGIPLSGDFPVEALASATEPATATTKGGGFIITWTSDGSTGDDPSATSIAARRFDAAGAPVSAQFQVNTTTTGAQDQPDVAAGAGGNFIIAWQSDGATGSDTEASSIAVRAFDATGAALGTQAQVNIHTTGVQESPAVSRQGDDFVVVWQGDTADDTSGSGIAGRRVGSSGTPLGDELQVNAFIAGSQREPAIAEQPGGRFVVSWTRFAAPGDPDDAIAARFFAADGRPIGDELQVNTFTTEAQYGSAIASAPGGDFVVVWTSFGTAAGETDYAIVGQRFSADIFADGFESGDTGAW